MRFVQQTSESVKKSQDLERVVADVRNGKRNGFGGPPDWTMHRV
jgi:hypothetical protein